MKYKIIKRFVENGKLLNKKVINSSFIFLIHLKNKLFSSLNALKNTLHVANMISFFGLLINIILAYFTFQLYEKTVEANNMSRDAVTESVNANKIAREANSEAKTANKINDTLLKFTRVSNKSSDSLNRENMNLTKQSIQAQITAMVQDKEQFLLLNRAFLTIDQIKITDSIKKGNFLKISYRITNPGTYPAELISSSNNIYIGHKRDLSLEKPTYTSFVSGFVTKEIPMNGIATQSQSLTQFDEDMIRKNENQVYFRFDGVYIDQLTNKKKRYYMVCRINDESQKYVILESQTANLE